MAEEKNGALGYFPVYATLKFISTVAVKLIKNGSWPFAVAIFFVLSLILLGLTSNGHKTPKSDGVWGGPAVDAPVNPPVAINQGAILAVASAVGHANGPSMNELAAASVLNAGLKDETSAMLSSPIGQTGILKYSVQKGDNLSKVAGNFGISVETLIAANPKIKGRGLRIGEELNVLPVSGIIYYVREKESLESIAASFKISVRQITEFNRGVDFNDLQQGTALVIPGAKPAQQVGDSGALPNLNKYFIMPTEGFNWGKLHAQNAVDIANACGTEVWAAAEGLVVETGSPQYMNNGYGGFVLAEHPNGTKTRYAHLGQLAAQLGDYVKQGGQVGTMGATGNVHGPTGCHLHFEVYGAQNPFAKN